MRCLLFHFPYLPTPYLQVYLQDHPLVLLLLFPPSIMIPVLLAWLLRLRWAFLFFSFFLWQVIVTWGYFIWNRTVHYCKPFTYCILLQHYVSLRYREEWRVHLTL